MAEICKGLKLKLALASAMNRLRSNIVRIGKLADSLHRSVQISPLRGAVIGFQCPIIVEMSTSRIGEMIKSSSGPSYIFEVLCNSSNINLI